MTGYGIAEQTYNTKKISVEIKTLNSKQLDLQVKLPNELRFAELDFRNRIGAKLQRGKVDVVISITDTDLSQSYHIDQDIVKAYKDQIEAISSSLGIAPANDLASVLFRMPGIFNVPVENYDDAFVAKVGETLDQALDIVDGFRVQEGNTLKKDLLHRVELILDLLGQVEPYEKSRLRDNMTKTVSSKSSSIISRNSISRRRRCVCASIATISTRVVTKTRRAKNLVSSARRWDARSTPWARKPTR